MRYSDLMTVAMDLDLDPSTALAHAESGGMFLRSADEQHSFAAPARTLTSLLSEVSAPLNFDLLSLDVEGNELAVLRGLDFSRYKPRWILVEVRSAEVEQYLESVGYRCEAVLSDRGDYRDVLFCSK